VSIPTVVLPADPREVISAILKLRLPAILPGWRCGWRQDQGFIQNISPGRFIGLEILGGAQLSHVHDRFEFSAQVWGDNGITDDGMRYQAAQRVAAHLHQAINARRISEPIVLPDPFDESATRSITQVTMTALLKGEDQ